MTAFHDIRFPFAPALGVVGGPERRTEIVALASGREERNSPWAHSRRRWDAGPGIRSRDDLATLIAFFEARRGRLYGFRFRDPLDHKSARPSQPISALDQPLGLGDGSKRVFALIKRYQSGSQAYDRPIQKPVVETVVGAVDGVPAALSVRADGRVEFDVPPPDGAAVSAGFAFDTPVRFDIDRLDISVEALDAGAAPSVPIIEIRL